MKMGNWNNIWGLVFSMYPQESCSTTTTILTLQNTIVRKVVMHLPHKPTKQMICIENCLQLALLQKVFVHKKFEYMLYL